MVFMNESLKMSGINSIPKIRPLVERVATVFVQKILNQLDYQELTLFLDRARGVREE